jgi:hypothetical protein
VDDHWCRWSESELTWVNRCMTCLRRTINIIWIWILVKHEQAGRKRTRRVRAGSYPGCGVCVVYCQCQDQGWKILECSFTCTFGNFWDNYGTYKIQNDCMERTCRYLLKSNYCLGKNRQQITPFVDFIRPKTKKIRSENNFWYPSGDLWN